MELLRRDIDTSTMDKISPFIDVNIQLKYFIIKFKSYSLSSLNKHYNLFLDELSRKIISYKYLPKNWDSDNAEPIYDNSIDIANSLLEQLAFNDIIIDYSIPMRDGGVQLEKTFSNNDVEIEINPDNVIVLLIFDKDANCLEEENYSLSKINALIRKFKSLDG